MVPKIILICISLIGLGISMANHGKPRSNESFWTTLVAVTLQYSLLYWGGFFNNFIR